MKYQVLRIKYVVNELRRHTLYLLRNTLYPPRWRSQRGAGLLEVVVGVALTTVVFVGFFGVLQLGTRLASDSKARTTALALANERVEFLRSLVYDDIGTLEGGDQNNGHGNDPDDYDEGNPGHGGSLGDDFDLFSTYYETITLNGVEYTRRSLVTFIDDASDGQSGHDEDHERDDYKVIKVSVWWDSRGEQQEVSLVTNAAPPVIE